MTSPCKTLLIDADPPDRGILRNRLRDAGHSVVEMSEWQAGLEAAKSNSWDAIVVAFRSEGVLLGKLIGQLASTFAGRDQMAIIAYEARTEGEPDDIGPALQSGVDAYLGRSELPALAAVLDRRLQQCRQLLVLKDTCSGLKHRRKVLQESPNGGASQNPGGVEAVFLSDAAGVVIASDTGAGRLVGQSPVGRPVGDSFQRIDADRLFARASSRPLISEPFEWNGAYGASGAPMELSVVELLSQGEEPAIKLALVSQHVPGRSNAPIPKEPESSQFRHGGLKAAAEQQMGLSSYLGHHPAIEALRESAREAAASAEPFLIIGSQGAGARKLAKAIHCTKNPLAPLVKLQAGLVPSSWILQSLAQSGPQSVGRGDADRTLLIAHVDQLALEDQATLAGLLDSGQVLLTSSQPPQALHPKLTRAIGDRFMVVPSLRERMEDLPLIAKRSVARLSRRASIDAEAIQSLMQYPWPGNVAELESCLISAHHAAAVHADPNHPVVIHREDLPEAVLHYRFQQPGVRQSAHGEAPPWQVTDADPIDFDVYERKAILRALHVCKGNRLACARMLRLGKSTLYRKLKRLGIEE